MPTVHSQTTVWQWVFFLGESWERCDGGRYQTKINAVLRAYMEHERSKR